MTQEQVKPFKRTSKTTNFVRGDYPYRLVRVITICWGYYLEPKLKNVDLILHAGRSHWKLSCKKMTLKWQPQAAWTTMTKRLQIRTFRLLEHVGKHSGLNLSSKFDIEDTFLKSPFTIRSTRQSQ